MKLTERRELANELRRIAAILEADRPDVPQGFETIYEVGRIVSCRDDLREASRRMKGLYDQITAERRRPKPTVIL